MPTLFLKDTRRELHALVAAVAAVFVAVVAAVVVVAVAATAVIAVAAVAAVAADFVSVVCCYCCCCCCCRSCCCCRPFAQPAAYIFEKDGMKVLTILLPSRSLILQCTFVLGISHHGASAGIHAVQPSVINGKHKEIIVIAKLFLVNAYF